MGPPSSWHNHPQNPTSQYHTLGVKFQHSDLGGTQLAHEREEKGCWVHLFRTIFLPTPVALPFARSHLPINPPVLLGTLNPYLCAAGKEQSCMGMQGGNETCSLRHGCFGQGFLACRVLKMLGVLTGENGYGHRKTTRKNQRQNTGAIQKGGRGRTWLAEPSGT